MRLVDGWICKLADFSTVYFSTKTLYINVSNQFTSFVKVVGKHTHANSVGKHTHANSAYYIYAWV